MRRRQILLARQLEAEKAKETATEPKRETLTLKKKGKDRG